MDNKHVLADNSDVQGAGPEELKKDIQNDAVDKQSQEQQAPRGITPVRSQLAQEDSSQNLKPGQEQNLTMNQQNQESFQNLNGGAIGKLNQPSKDGLQMPGSQVGSIPMFGSNVSEPKQSPRDIIAQGGVIDLESENLSYPQAKAIRVQVQKDCELLRNRVRMLQNEMNRARKKIEETRKKTHDIKRLKYENDVKFMKKIQMEQIKEEQVKPNYKLMDSRMQSTQEIQEKRRKILQNKKKEVEIYKAEQTRNKEQLISYRIESEKQNWERKMLIREQLQRGQLKKQEFLDQKRKNAKREVNNMMDMQRNDIQNYEKEAEDLEKLEAELLQRLQETQKREKDVFGKLETAMIDASIPKKQRVGGMLQQINHKNGSASNIM